ncbi:MAG: hypothetical protein KDB22_26560 [Planctomycetales bacterium]|nr:hypothetical protein [Planctomycetales bacterium]
MITPASMVVPQFAHPLTTVPVITAPPQVLQPVSTMPQLLHPLLTGAAHPPHEGAAAHPQLETAWPQPPQVGAASQPQLDAGALHVSHVLHAGAGAAQQVGAGAAQQVGAGAGQHAGSPQQSFLAARLAFSLANNPTRLGLPPHAGAGSQQTGAGSQTGSQAGTPQQSDLAAFLARRPAKKPPPPQLVLSPPQLEPPHLFLPKAACASCDAMPAVNSMAKPAMPATKTRFIGYLQKVTNTRFNGPTAGPSWRDIRLHYCFNPEPEKNASCVNNDDNGF